MRVLTYTKCVLLVWICAVFSVAAETVLSGSEHRYATKNMLTVAQNEQIDGGQDSATDTAVADAAVSTDTPVVEQAPEEKTEIEPEVPAPESSSTTSEQTAAETPAPEPVAAPEQAPVSEEAVPYQTPAPEEPKKNNGNGAGKKKSVKAELIGIDTINIDEPEGNWLYKRMYWEQAEYRYEKVKALLEKIMDIRMDFFKKQVDADKNLFDPFYLEVGIKDGKIEQTIDDLIAYMDKERDAKGALDEQERDFLALLQQERAVLEQLRQDVQGIKKIDETINNAILILMQEIGQARGFERQAWQNFKAIARELSDKKAHDLYHGIEAYWQNMKDIHIYVSTQLSSYFQQLISKAQEQIAKVRTTMDALKERGVDLKEHAQKMEQAGMERSQAEQQIIKKPVKQGIFRRMLGGIGSFFGAFWHYAGRMVTGVWQGIKAPFGGVFSKKPVGQPVLIPVPPAVPGQPTELSVGEPNKSEASHDEITAGVETSTLTSDSERKPIDTVSAAA